MGRLFIPAMMYTHRVSPLEHLLQGLVEALQGTETETPDNACRRHCDTARCCKSRQARTGCSGFKPWFYSTVNIGAYRPNEVNVKVENGCVVIHARREERNGGDYDIFETKRIVKLPEALDKKEVVCFLCPDGRVLIKARPSEKPNSQDSAKADITAEEGVKDTKGDGETSQRLATDYLDTVQSTDPNILKISPASQRTIETETNNRAKETVENLSFSKGNSEPVAAGADDHDAADETDATVEFPDDATYTRHPPSPTPSDDFSIIDELTVNTINDCPREDLTEKNEHVESVDGESLDRNQELKPLTDSVRVVDDGNRKTFEVSLNLKDFDPENMVVRLVDNDLFVDAKKKVNSLQEVHRKYPVPEAGILDAAQAHITSDGMVTVTVPLESDEKYEPRTIPIVQLE